MQEQEYERQKAKQYAKKWAYDRNPFYYNYDALGGDCTNFVSQCLYEGSKVMNYEPHGWYYKTANQKTPSWTGVDFLYQFLVKNKSVGPFGKVSSIDEIQIGDVVQLSFQNAIFSHSLLVVEKEGTDLDKIYIASHTDDSYHRVLSSYLVESMRFVHIQGFRTWS